MAQDPDKTLFRRISGIVGEKIQEIFPMNGSGWASVRRLRFRRHPDLVLKTGQKGGFALEGWMLEELAAPDCLPVPEVLVADSDMLLLEFRGDGRPPDAAAWRELAEGLAKQHEVSQPQFGLDRDSLIGPLPQRNQPEKSWLQFFANHRLRFMAASCHDAGRLDPSDLDQLERLIEQLPLILTEDHPPSLLHGDLWAGNILADDRQLCGIIDPAIYFGNAEAELAFLDMFGGPGPDFFRLYGQIRGWPGGWYPEFARLRKPVYQLYPLLVHTRLFGGAWTDSFRQQLRQLLSQGD